jgi:hypothetical protein
VHEIKNTKYEAKIRCPRYNDNIAGVVGRNEIKDKGAIRARRGVTMHDGKGE